MRPKIIAAVVVLAVTLVSGPGIGAPPPKGPSATPPGNFGPCGDPKTVPAGLISIKSPTPNKYYSAPDPVLLVCGPGPTLDVELQRKGPGSTWSTTNTWTLPYQPPPQYAYSKLALPVHAGTYRIRVKPSGRATWSDWVPFYVTGSAG